MYYYGRLRDLREDADLTQKEAGALLGTTQQQYAKYELGVQEIPVHHLITLANHYHVTTDYILGRMSWEEVELFRQLEKLPQTEQQQLFHTLSSKRTR